MVLRVLPGDTETVPLPRPLAADASAPDHPRPGIASSPLGDTTFSDEDGLGNAGPTVRLPARLSVSGPTARAVPSWRLFAPTWSWLWAAWIAGAATVLSGPMAGRIALRRWVRAAQPIVGDDWTALLTELSLTLGLRRRVALLQSDHGAVPMTWGWIRPVVLLPAEAAFWSIDRRRDVLLHELHARPPARLPDADDRSRGLRGYWFHPLAWAAARCMRIERERACDDVVLLAGTRASDYAGHLLEIARGCASRVPPPWLRWRWRGRRSSRVGCWRSSTRPAAAAPGPPCCDGRPPRRSAPARPAGDVAPRCQDDLQ